MKIMNRFFAAAMCAAALCFGNTIYAEVSSLTSTPASAAPDIVVTAEHKDAIKDLLDAMNFKQTMSQMAGAMTQNMPQLMEQMFANSAKLSDAEKTEVRKLIAKSATTASKAVVEIYSDPQVVQGMEDIMARTYAKNFSIDEIKAMTTFYLSPAGKKILTNMPQMMQQTMPEIMGLVAPRVNAMMTKMMDELAVEAKSKTTGAPAKK